MITFDLEEKKKVDDNSLIIKDNLEIISHDIYTDHEQINICPLADVHMGSIECREKEFRNFVNKILDMEDTYVMLVGDLCDTGLKNSLTDIYKSTMSIMDQQIAMVDILRPLANAGRILSITSGNHENRISREVGMDASFIIAQALGIGHLYRPGINFVRVRINPNNPNHRWPVYNLVATHGSGGGQTMAFINKNQNFGMTIDGADVLITGHTHKPAITVPSKMKINPHKNVIEVEPFYCVTATAWLSYGGYAIEKQFVPVSSRPQIISLNSKTKDMCVTM